MSMSLSLFTSTSNVLCSVDIAYTITQVRQVGILVVFIQCSSRKHPFITLLFSYYGHYVLHTALCK